MGYQTRRLTLPIVLSATLLLTVAGLSFAGEFHIDKELNCSQCHVMHASDQHATGGAKSYNGGAGYDSLLKYGTITETCLGCHGGTSSTPGVMASGSSTAPTNTGLNTLYYTEDPQYLNSSGFFQVTDWKTAANAQAHDLYTTGTPVTAVQGTWTTASIAGHVPGMTCGDCHAVHGSPNWRNLRTDVGGTTGKTVSYAESGTADVQQHADLETDTSPRHYETKNAAFAANNGIVDWCVACHTNITTGSKHPQNAAVSSGDSDGTTDSADWTTGTGIGFGNTVDDAATGGDVGIPRVRFAQAGSSYVACSTPGPDNQAFCLTCHKGHGSKYSAALIWPMGSFKDSLGNRYTPVDRSAGCRQCHPQGQVD
jgi:hypothetical protein